MILLRLLVHGLLFYSTTIALLGPRRSSPSSKDLSIASEHSPLQKRAPFRIEGPATDDQKRHVEALIHSCRETARNIVNNVQDNHAIFLRFFGTTEYYSDIMRVFQRIAQIGEDTPPEQAHSHQVTFRVGGAPPTPNGLGRYMRPRVENGANSYDENAGGDNGSSGSENESNDENMSDDGDESDDGPLILIWDTVLAQDPLGPVNANIPNILERASQWQWTTVMHEVSPSLHGVLVLDEERLWLTLRLVLACALCQRSPVVSSPSPQ